MKNTLMELEGIIRSKAGSNIETSYTAGLLSKGTDKCCEKFGEEAIEFIIASTKNDFANLKEETADVLYHMLVVLVAHNINLEDVLDILQQRMATSGLLEKANRK